MPIVQYILHKTSKGFFPLTFDAKHAMSSTQKERKCSDGEQEKRKCMAARNKKTQVHDLRLISVEIVTISAGKHKRMYGGNRTTLVLIV